MKLIPLTQGKFSMVDDEDFEALSQHSWQYAYCDGREYARRTIRVGEKRVVLPMHRAILPHDLPHTDHADGNGLNNQKLNLRPCTRAQNGYNRKTQKHSSLYKGVSWFAAQRKYGVTIQVDGKRVHLGYFTDPAEGARIYDHAARQFFGHFARTNFNSEVSLGV